MTFPARTRFATDEELELSVLILNRKYLLALGLTGHQKEKVSYVCDVCVVHFDQKNKRFAHKCDIDAGKATLTAFPENCGVDMIEGRTAAQNGTEPRNAYLNDYHQYRESIATNAQNDEHQVVSCDP